MVVLSSPGWSRCLLAAAATGALLISGSQALAAAGATPLKTAETACLDKAFTLGWRQERAKVVSSRALDADRVEVVLDLSKDGVHTARLTCPYSAKSGVGNAFTTRKAEVGSAPEGEVSAPAGIPVQQGRAWWLLLPLALGVGSWLWLQGRDQTAGYVRSTAGVTTTGGGGSWNAAEAASREGFVELRERADPSSRVLRQLRNGETFEITGVRRRDDDDEEWLEVRGGGWVRDGESRYDRNIVR
ncbi:MAG: SH3 domain-containing protein [Cyanobacteriota bacterium]